MWLGPVMFPLLSTFACDHTAYSPPALSMASTAKSWPTVHSGGHAVPVVGLKTTDRVHVTPWSVDLFTATSSAAGAFAFEKAVWMAKTWSSDSLTWMLPAIPSLQSTATKGLNVLPPSVDRCT